MDPAVANVKREGLDVVTGPRRPVPSTELALATIALSLKSERQDYKDTRSGVAAHPAIDFSVVVNRDVSAMTYLREFLGADAEGLMGALHDKIDFRKNVPGSNKATLLLDSNEKNREGQVQSLKASGLEFADDLQAAIVCATVFRKAIGVGLCLTESTSCWKVSYKDAVSKLDEKEIDLLTKLRDGSVRSRSFDFFFSDWGRLCASSTPSNTHPNSFVFCFGASPSAAQTI